MKKIFAILVLLIAANSVRAQFPTTDSLERFINRYIRNSAVEAFQNLRLNTALIGMKKFIDSAYGGQIKSFDKANDTTIRIITLANDTLTVNVSTGGGTDTTSLSARINAKKSLQRHYGTIYNDNSWATVTENLNNNGVTASVVSNKINVSGGAGTFTQTLDIPGGTLLEKFKISGKFKATEKSSTSYGFGVGTRSINSFATLNCAARFDATSSGNGTLSVQISGRNVAGSALGFSVNDYIIVTVERDVDLFTVSAKNVNTGATTSLTYRCDPTDSPALPNTGTFSVFSYGGTFTLDSLNVTSKEIKNAGLIVLGDSKTQLAGTGVTFSNRYAAQLGNSFTTIISAGSSDRTAEVMARTSEIIALKPLQALMAIGSNDPRSGVSSSTTNANYDTIVNRLTAAGIKVYHLLPFPESYGGSEGGVDQSVLRAHIVATYAAADIIDTETPLLACASCLSADDVHPNEEAQTIIANTIIESFKLNDVSQGAGDVAYRSKENTFTERQTISGTFTSRPAFEANSFIVQPYGVNNVFQGDNFRYNGSAFVRKYDGYSSIWYQQNGAHIFQTAGTSTAGTSISYTTRLKVFNNGNIGNTDSDPGVAFGIVGSAKIAPNSAGAAGLTIGNTGGGESAIIFANDKMIASNGQYVSIDAVAGYPIYLGFNTTSNSGNTVNIFNNRASFGNDGTLYIGRTTKVGSEVFSNNGRSYFGDTGTLAMRFSYTRNLGSTFTEYSLVDKHYVDSAVAAGGGGGGNGIYGGSGSLPSDVTVSGAGNDLNLGDAGDKLAALTTNVTGTSTYNSNAHTFNDGAGHSFGMTSAGFFMINGSLNAKVERATDANTSVTTSSCVFILPAITANRTLSLPATAREGMIYIIINTNSSGNTWQFGGGGSLVDQTGAAVTSFTNGNTYIIMGDSSANIYRILTKQ